MEMPHVRGIKEALAEVRAADPDTRITEYAVRCAIKTGELPRCGSGRNIYIDVGELKKFMRGGK